ncbi:UNVERIFIED_CONTAM: hypothetical protein Sradi_2043500 [Sesamum radiatum]|uniref:Retrotransposon gag protein n=1 Tax=Sesamum radiatum TaxID=300843 RepID=A0AAW2TH24_SESRA
MQQNTQQFQQNTQQFQQSVQMSIQHLKSQMSQLASSVGRLESQGKFPSQPIVNSKHNGSAIVLHSGKELQEHMDKNSTKRGHAQKRKAEKEVKIPKEQNDMPKDDHPKVLVTRPPFLERFAKSKKEEEEKEIFETFRKVEVNIPLLDAIKQIPRYAKFLKELCTKIGVVIQLADQSAVYPEGVLEDVLVQDDDIKDNEDSDASKEEEEKNDEEERGKELNHKNMEDANQTITQEQTT